MCNRSVHADDQVQATNRGRSFGKIREPRREVGNLHAVKRCDVARPLADLKTEPAYAVDLPQWLEQPQIDRAEELRKEWGVEPGQLWLLPSNTLPPRKVVTCPCCGDEVEVD